MFEALERHWDSDEFRIKEWIRSGLDNVKLCLALNEEVEAFLQSDPSLEEYCDWLCNKGTSRRLAPKCMDKLRKVHATRLRTCRAAYKRLTT